MTIENLDPQIQEKIKILISLAEKQGLEIDEEQAQQVVEYCWSYVDDNIDPYEEAEDIFRFKDTDDMFNYLFEDYNDIINGMNDADFFYPNRLETINRDFFNNEKLDMTMQEMLLSTKENLIYLGEDKYVFFYQ